MIIGNQAKLEKERALLGRKIKLTRIAYGLTQAELAELLDITQYTVSAWERGFHNPKPEHFKSLCRVFEVESEYFTRPDGIPNRLANDE